MVNPTPFLRRLAGAACVALLGTCLAPGAGVAEAGGATAVPLARSAGDTVVIVPAATELQLLNGPGVKRAHSVAKPGTTQWVGKKASGRPVVSRLFYSFDLSGLPADAITEVTLEHWQSYSPNRTCYLDSYGPPVRVVTTKTPSSRPHWPGPPVTSSSVASGYALGSRQACFPNIPQHWDVTDMVRTAAQASSKVHLRLASANEKKKSGYRTYDTETNGTPSLRVFLRPHPDKPTHLTVDGLAPKSPTSPLTTTYSTAAIRAELTTPGGCPGTPLLFTCLAARYELTAPDGTVVSAGQNNSLFGTDGIGRLTQSVGPMVEGLDYLVKVWGVNTQTGLESLEPGTITIRYNAHPTAPTVTVPISLKMGKPIQVTVTAHDSDATQVCWQIETGGDPLGGCSDITPQEPTEVTLGTIDGLAQLNGSLWVVDDLGIAGTGATIQGTVSW